MASGVESLCQSHYCSCTLKKEQDRLAISSMSRSNSHPTKIVDSLKFSGVFHWQVVEAQDCWSVLVWELHSAATLLHKHLQMKDLAVSE